MNSDIKTVFDPLRKKEVARTPEEEVRQWCIGVLSSSFGVPMHMMMSEASLRLGGKNFRADIVVYDRNVRPVAVVECKRPDVVLDADVLDQVIRYNMVLDVGYLIITNGHKTYVCRRVVTDGKVSYAFTDNLPDYNTMICQQQ
jgi:hypothetical protein